MPAAEVDLTPDLVRRLLADQHPDLAGLPVTVLANGWDNLVCRLGDDLLVRLPRRTLAAELLAHEQRWLPELAPRLPLLVPAPARTGRPGLGYPWPWSVVPFFPGQIAAERAPADLRETATTLARFLRALHVPAPADAPASPVRGIPLAGRAETFARNLEVLGAGLDRAAVDRAAVLRIWETALAAPRWERPPTWLHGDLHPANMLVSGGRLSAVIDWGDITRGDPAGDLSAVWMLLPATQHGAFRDAYQPDEATWLRGQGWALALAIVFLANSADNPLIMRIGERTLRTVLAS
jgi:aminoglycoside phosphotransferase (APT) family kinase protein